MKAHNEKAERISERLMPFAMASDREGFLDELARIASELAAEGIIERMQQQETGPATL